MKTVKLKIKNSKGGYAIIELLFYISIFAILVLVVINSMIVMTKSFRETTIHAQFIGTGSIMERISREIRQAGGINSISASNLVLNTTDTGGAPKTVQFTLSGSNIDFLENGVSTGNLNSLNIIVSSLVFSEITIATGKAVKVFLTISSAQDPLSRSVDFYNTVVLRGDY